jgi:hypothetical protein
MAKNSLSWISKLISTAENLREWYVLGWNRLSVPYWESTELNANCDASTSKKNGFEESASAWIRIGSDMNAFLSASKASSAFSFYTNLSFLVRWVNRTAILE